MKQEKTLSRAMLYSLKGHPHNILLPARLHYQMFKYPSLWVFSFTPSTAQVDSLFSPYLIFTISQTPLQGLRRGLSFPLCFLNIVSFQCSPPTPPHKKPLLLISSLVKHDCMPVLFMDQLCSFINKRFLSSL